MRTGITFPLAPTGESGSAAMDEVYDELWDLNVANIRHYISGRAYRDTLRYLEDCRSNGSADAEGVTFMFYEGAGCHLSSALCQHWFQVSMATLATQLKPMLAGLGTSLGPIGSVKKAQKASGKFIEYKSVVYGITDDENGLQIWNDIDGDLCPQPPTAVRRARSARDTCACELCRKLSRRVRPIDVVAWRRQATQARTFTSFSKAARSVRQARVLFLDDRRLTRLPDDIGRLVWLEELHAWDNLLTGLPPSIGELRRLTLLNLRGNQQLASLPPELGRLTKLERLILGGSRDLTQLPPELARLRTLKHLDLTDMRLRSIPAWFEQLTGLESLRLQNVPLQELPLVLTRLPNLKQLDLRGTAPVPLTPSPITEPWQDASYAWNQALIEACRRGEGDVWQTFPFDALGSLETIMLSGVSKIPESLLRCTTLRELDIYGCHPIKLAPIPDQIAQLKRLRRLHYGPSHTRTLPPALFTLQELADLSFEGSQVTHVPDGIAALTQLKMLYIRRNPIASVSPEICKCVGLTHVYMSGTALGEVPAAIRELPLLETLST